MSSAKLDQIFEAIFQRPVGDHEDIFDLGANSLTAIQLIGQVNEAFGANINMEQFFQTPCKQTVLAQLQATPAAQTA
jgi:coronamic acid synthetase CmaD carrier protein